MEFVDFICYVEGSKRSSHSNAYMYLLKHLNKSDKVYNKTYLCHFRYGFHKNKRIVLFDSLIEGYKPAEAAAKEEDSNQNEESKSVNNSINESSVEEALKGCSNPEIIAILAHELGHWKLNHNVKNLLINEVIQLNLFTLTFLLNLILLQMRK